MEYVKSPVIIDAQQWHPGIVIAGIHEETLCDIGVCYQNYFINTLEGKMVIHDGDWIITGIEGEMYPCKDSIFQKTYQKVISTNP